MSTKNIKNCKILHSYFIIMGQWVSGSDLSKNGDPFDP